MNTALNTLYTRFVESWTDEQGAEMVEWLGMLAIVLVAGGVIATGVGTSEVGTNFSNKFIEAVKTPQNNWGAPGGN